MTSRLIFGGKHASETINLVFDFTSRLALSETISSATVTATVYSGSDPAPSSLVQGSAAISGQKVTQRVGGGVLGVTYWLSCIAVTSTNQHLAASGFLVITPDSL